jgi:predicted amidohydrolase YtcJ
MRELGVATNLFTNHIYYWGDLPYSTFIGPDRAEDMDPAGSAQRRFHCAPSPPRLLEAIAVSAAAQ